MVFGPLRGKRGLGNGASGGIHGWGVGRCFSVRSSLKSPTSYQLTFFRHMICVSAEGLWKLPSPAPFFSVLPPPEQTANQIYEPPLATP